MNTVKNGKDLSKMKAKEIMTSPVITVQIRDSMKDVAKIFTQNNISGAPVLDDVGLPIGVITKTDLTRYDTDKVGATVVEHPKDLPRGYHVQPEDDRLEGWMTPFIFDVYPETPLPELVKKMLKLGLHHLFVTDKETKFVRGIITSFDMIKILARTLNAEPLENS